MNIFCYIFVWFFALKIAIETVMENKVLVLLFIFACWRLELEY